MNDIYVPPDFIGSHLLPYLTEVLDAGLTEAADIYEFSARYFEEKAKERHLEKSKEFHERNSSSNIPNVKWEDHEEPDFDYRSTAEWHATDLADDYETTDDMKKNIVLQECTTHPTVQEHASCPETKVNKKLKSTQQQRMVENLLDQRESKIVDQITDFAELLPEYISVMVDLMESLGEKVQAETKKKLSKEKNAILNEKIVRRLNHLQEETASKAAIFRNVDPQMSSFDGDKVCSACDFKQGLPLTSQQENKFSDNIPVAKQVSRLLEEIKAGIPQSLTDESIEEETQIITAADINKHEDNVDPSLINDLLSSGKKFEDTPGGNQEFRKIIEELVRNVEDSDIDSPSDLLKSIQSKPKKRERECGISKDCHPADPMKVCEEIPKKIEEIQVQSFEVTEPHKKYFIFEQDASSFGGSEIDSSQDFVPKLLLISDPVMDTHKIEHTMSCAAPELENDFCLSLPTERTLPVNIIAKALPNQLGVFKNPPEMVTDVAGTVPQVDKHFYQATENLKRRIQRYKEIQHLERVERLSKGNGSSSYNVFNDNTGVPVSGRSWLRTYLTVQTVKRIRQDDWRTLYVKEQDDDLGQPFWALHLISSGDSSSFQWYSLFKACRTWYFARRIRAFQKELDSKQRSSLAHA